MNDNYYQLFQILKASLFTNEDVEAEDPESVFKEMKKQSVATIPWNWLREHRVPRSEAWDTFCITQQTNWIKVMYWQDQALKLFEKNSIPCVIIKGAAAAMAYPYPTLRSMGDVDILVKRSDFLRAASVMEENGFCLTHDKDHAEHHYSYSKSKIVFELHRRLSVLSDSDEGMLSYFEKGIDDRVFRTIEGYSFPVLPPELNGLVLIFHINQHLRSGLGLRQIIDWMMYVNDLSSEIWENKLIPMLQRTGMERLAFTTTVMCQKYFGLRTIVDDKDYPCDELMEYIMEKGNFGRKAGAEGKTASFYLSTNTRGGFFKRLQTGGQKQWKSAKKYKFLRPFAWIYQSFRIFGIILKNKLTLKEIATQRAKSNDQRELIEKLGLDLDRTIHGT